VSPDSPRNPRLHRHREVQERGVVLGRLKAALPNDIEGGDRFTSLLISTKGSPATWYEARGHQPDLLDDALLNQIVEFSWERYERSTRRYITGPVTTRPPTPPGTRQR